MPRKGPNIYKRKDGRWEGRYAIGRSDGRTHYHAVYAHTYTEAKQKLDEAKKEREKKKLPDIKAGKVSDVGKCWLAEASNSLKQTSIVKYEDLLRCYILPELGEEELSDITNERLIRFVSRLRMSGGVKGAGLSTATVSEVLTVLNALRVYALKRDLTVRFTTECVSLRQEQGDIRVFSREEEKRLLAYLPSIEEFTALGIYIVLYTGIRVGELCALTWNEISLSERTIKVGKTMQRIRVDGESDRKTEVKILEPKSVCSIRMIPIPGILMERLRVHYTPGAFVLTGDKKEYVEPRTMQNRFKRILKDCGITDANFHATRHTFATRCVELGFDIKTLSELLGHSNVAFTMSRYVHPTMALKAENMEKLSGLFRED